MNEPMEPWSRALFRSVVAWPARIRREEPFLNGILGSAPDKSLADLGCGTGEHSRHYAAKGWQVSGLDASPESIEAALRETPPELVRGVADNAAATAGSVEFVVGDLRESDVALRRRFGAALCLGNTLPFLTGPGDLDRAFESIFRSLLPGGVLILQILNYAALRLKGARHLPLNFQSAEDGELVFLRLIEFPDERRVLFFPTTLRLRKDEATPVEVLRSHRIDLIAWTGEDIAPGLSKAGFTDVRIFGSMLGDAFDPGVSPDLVGTARRP